MQLGPDGVSLAAMQGLQPYLQATGSQGLSNNLLQSHPSLQGECLRHVALAGCLGHSQFLSCLAQCFWSPPDGAEQWEVCSKKPEWLLDSVREMVHRCLRRWRGGFGPADAAAAVHLTTIPSQHAPKGKACSLMSRRSSTAGNA